MSPVTSDEKKSSRHLRSSVQLCRKSLIITENWFSTIEFRHALAAYFEGRTFLDKTKRMVHWISVRRGEKRLYNSFNHTQCWKIDDNEIDALCTLYSMYHIVELDLSLPPLRTIQQEPEHKSRLTQNAFLLKQMLATLAADPVFWKIARKTWRSSGWTISELKREYRRGIREFDEIFVRRFPEVRDAIMKSKRLLGTKRDE